MLYAGSDPRRLPVGVLVDEIAEGSDAVRVARLVRELRRRKLDRGASSRFVVWLYGADAAELIVMPRALLAQVAGDNPPLSAA